MKPAMKRGRLTKDAPYLMPAVRRQRAVEVADKTFLRAQKAITVLLDENARLRAALGEARDTARLDGLTQWVEFFERALSRDGE